MQVDDKEYAALLADALRYRWLRERSTYRSDMPVVCVQWAQYDNGHLSHCDYPSHDELDAAIDAARQQEKP